MTKMAIISDEQAKLLYGQMYDGCCFFNPVQDINGNWVISEEEALRCNNKKFIFLNKLEFIEMKSYHIKIIKDYADKKGIILTDSIKEDQVAAETATSLDSIQISEIKK